MSPERYNSLALAAYDAAIAASRAIMQVYEADADFGVKTKDDNTPVTRADFASNRVITEMLAETGIPILSEESEQQDYAVRSEFPLLWVVDPLDGTKEFIKQNDMFCVCIALVENHRPILGAVCLPTDNMIYYTVMSDEGIVSAYRSTYGADGEPEDEMMLPLDITADAPHVIVGSVSHASEMTEKLADGLREVSGWEDVEIRGVGSCIKQCMIAEGTAAFYVRGPGTKEWDTAAGQAILEASMASLVEIPSGEPLAYNRPNLGNPGFLASAQNIDRAAMAAAHKVCGISK